MTEEQKKSATTPKVLKKLAASAVSLQSAIERLTGQLAQEEEKRQIETAQTDLPGEPWHTEILTTKYGSFALHIYGDPNRVLDIPIGHFEGCSR